MIPATAGRIISEEELRAFTRCSQLFHYGGKVEESLLTTIVRSTVEHMIVLSLKDDIKNPSMDFVPSLRRVFIKYKVRDLLPDGEADALLRAATYALHNVWKILGAADVLTISGPLDYRVVVSKTPVALRISGVLRKRASRELIVPVFSPATNSHTSLNDPLLHLKLDVVSQFGIPHHLRATASAYVFAIQPDGDVVFNLVKDTENQTRLKMIESQIKAMEIGFHYPVLPCTYACPFKGRCFPEKDNE